jgi:hypothetical protein
VGEDEREAAQAEAEDGVADLRRPAVVRELEQEQVGPAAQPEPAQRLVVEPGQVGEVELAAGQQLDPDPRLACRSAGVVG